MKAITFALVISTLGAFSPSVFADDADTGFGAADSTLESTVDGSADAESEAADVASDMDIAQDAGGVPVACDGALCATSTGGSGCSFSRWGAPEDGVVFSSLAALLIGRKRRRGPARGAR
jgi:hypothetical protein